MKKDYKNKQQKSESAKQAETPYVFPAHNIVINASSPEEARQKLEELLKKDEAKK